MKKVISIIVLLFSLAASAQVEDHIPARPSPPRLVNDLSGTLTSSQVEALESKLYKYDDSTSTQIAVVLIKSLKGDDVADYALALGRKWGVGGKEFNNGVVLLLAMDDHKSHIAVGYGLEGVIPDLTAKSILDNEITPNFKEKNYYRGLDEATDAIILATAGKYKAPEGYHSKKKRPGIGTIIFIIIILIIIFGSGGGRNGTYVSRGGSRGIPWWMFGGMGGGGSSGGGGWSGGSGGGFGGFGGGSFGGGGASGSW